MDQSASYVFSRQKVSSLSHRQKRHVSSHPLRELTLRLLIASLDTEQTGETQFFPLSFKGLHFVEDAGRSLSDNRP